MVIIIIIFYNKFSKQKTDEAVDISKQIKITLKENVSLSETTKTTKNFETTLNQSIDIIIRNYIIESRIKIDNKTTE